MRPEYTGGKHTEGRNKNCDRDKARSAGDKMLSRDPVTMGSDLENLTRASEFYTIVFISAENPQVDIT